tara:strand:+ start:455 stop:772 length:318 start_codon:yes stop_codon:yes gene_type:complete
VRKAFGKVKVRKVRADLDDIPEDCGYLKKFRFNIDMNSNGIMGECISWCQENCDGKWGWWFQGPESDNPYEHNWQKQNSYMSFQYKRDATRFWMAIGLQNMGNKD